MGEGIFTGQVLRLGRRRSAWPLVGDGVLARRAAAELGVSAGMGTSRAAPRAPWAYSPGSPAGTPGLDHGGTAGARRGLGAAGVACRLLEPVGAEASSVCASFIGGDIVASQAGCPSCCSEEVPAERGPPEASPPPPMSLRAGLRPEAELKALATGGSRGEPAGPRASAAAVASRRARAGPGAPGALAVLRPWPLRGRTASDGRVFSSQ